MCLRQGHIDSTSWQQTGGSRQACQKSLHADGFIYTIKVPTDKLGRFATMIDLPEGLYEVDQAYLVDADTNSSRLPLRDATFEVWLDKKGKKQIRGRAFIRNLQFAEMLADTENVDLVLCFFEDYFLWLKDPVIQVGKVFEPTTESSLIFSIGETVSLISEEKFLQLTGLG
jgi:hypothetical protein